MSSFRWQARLISAILQKNREILYITRHANEKHEERQQMEADRNGEEKKKKQKWVLGHSNMFD